MSCQHQPAKPAKANGAWSDDFQLVNTSGILVLDIKQIAAVDDNPFASYPISSEVKFNDLNNHGNLSVFLPFVRDSYYTVGTPDGSPAAFITHSRLQKPDVSGKDRNIDIFYCD